MATTRNQPEEETTVSRSDMVASAIAGQGIVRRTILYTILFASMGVAFYAPVLVVPALVAGVLLLATDKGLS